MLQELIILASDLMASPSSSETHEHVPINKTRAILAYVVHVKLDPHINVVEHLCSYQPCRLQMLARSTVASDCIPTISELSLLHSAFRKS
jgi:hypothetical protein